MSKRIIIADDDDGVRRSLCRFIRSYIKGSEVLEASTGEALIEKLKEGGYDLAFTDNDMGQGIRGLEAVRRVRAWGIEVPIYLLCWVEEREKFREEALRAGATGYIEKMGKNSMAEISEALRKHMV